MDENKANLTQKVSGVPSSSPQLWWGWCTKSSYSILSRTVCLQTLWSKNDQHFNPWSSLCPVSESESQCGYFTTNSGCLVSAPHEGPLSNEGLETVNSSGGLRLFEGQGRKNKKGTFWTTWGPTSGHSGFSNLMVFCSPNGALKAALPGRSYPLTLASAALKVPFGALVTSPCST